MGKMPAYLKFLAWALMILGWMAVIGCFTESWADAETGLPISRREAWESGEAWWVLLIGLGMLTVSVALFKRQRWVRFVFPVLFIVVIFYAVITGRDVTETMILCGCSFLLSSWYSFKSKGVVAYFAKRESQD